MSRPNRGPRLVFLRKRSAWYIRWTERGRTRERSCRTADHGEAQGQFGEFLIEHRRDRSGPRDPARYPIGEALMLYASEHAMHTADPKRIAACVDALLGFWEGNVVADITRETCRGYRKHRAAVKDGTVRTDLSCLRAALNHARAEGRLTHVPKVHLPEKPAGRDRWLRRSEAAALLWAAHKDPRARLHLPLFILLGLRTGARKGALLGLRWPQVDLERRLIDFNEPGRRRTKKGRPIIPIPRGLLGHLRRARERGTEMSYVLNIDGVRIGNVKHSFATAAIRAGLVDDKGRPTVTPHVLRHTAVTWMAQKGVPLFEIAGWLGHNHGRTTELYSHHCPDFLERARKAMD